MTKSSIVSVPTYGYSTKNENLTGRNMKIFYYLSDGYTSQPNYFEESSKIASGQIVEGKGYDVKQRRMLFGKRMDGSKYVVPSVSYKLNCTELPYCEAMKLDPGLFSSIGGEETCDHHCESETDVAALPNPRKDKTGYRTWEIRSGDTASVWLDKCSVNAELCDVTVDGDKDLQTANCVTREQATFYGHPGTVNMFSISDGGGLAQILPKPLDAGALGSEERTRAVERALSIYYSANMYVTQRWAAEAKEPVEFSWTNITESRIVEVTKETVQSCPSINPAYAACFIVTLILALSYPLTLKINEFIKKNASINVKIGSEAWDTFSYLLYTIGKEQNVKINTSNYKSGSISNLKLQQHNNEIFRSLGKNSRKETEKFWRRIAESTDFLFDFISISVV
ncbi:hypothetical protein HK098_002399 [Nowakowskiella sp. JEL0407]|nr:hypothetical protein HK098_002399 [Nowakowskiella sp. JEL0407]